MYVQLLHGTHKYMRGEASVEDKRKMSNSYLISINGRA